MSIASSSHMPDRVSVFGMHGSPACTQVRPFASLGTRPDPGWIHLTCACGSCGKVSDFVGVRSASSSFDYKANVVGVTLGCQPFAQPCNRYPLTPLLSRRWYILHYHRSTLLLPLGRGCCWWWWSGGEERSDVLHRGTNIYILQRSITVTAV